MQQVRQYTIVAVLLGLGAFILVGLALWALQQSIEERYGTRTTVVVARSDISAGTILTAGMLQSMPYLAAMAPPRAVADVSQLVGQTAAVPIYAGQPIVVEQIGQAGDKVDPTNLIAAGHVAFPLALDPKDGVGAFVSANDRVDLYGLAGDLPSLLLIDVRVVGIAGEGPFGPTPVPASDSSQTASQQSSSIGRSYTASGPYGPGVTGKVVLLELTNDQAATLAQALTLGHVTVVVRSSQAVPTP